VLTRYEIGDTRGKLWHYLPQNPRLAPDEPVERLGQQLKGQQI